MLALVLLLVAAVLADRRLIMDENYHKHEKPMGDPTMVYGELNLRNIQEVSDKKMLMSLEISLRLFWRDHRLRLNPALAEDQEPYTLDPERNSEYMLLKDPRDIAELWLPDVFIDQAIVVRHPQVAAPVHSIKVYKDSTVRFSKRMNFDIGCFMDFSNYPVDMQECVVIFESFSYQVHEMHFEWSSREGDENKDIRLPQYSHHIHMNRTYAPSDYALQYSNLRFKVHLVRRLEGVVISSLVPSLLFMAISYLALWVPHTTLVVRTSIAMFSLLTLASVQNQVRSEMPPISYFTLLDQFSIFGLVFVSVVILVIVTTAALRGPSGTPARVRRAERVEWWAKLLLPLLLAAWNLYYWSVLLVKYNHNIKVAAAGSDL